MTRRGPGEEYIMADARETLEIMRDVARSRIQMLKEGVTFYNDDRKDYYLREYESKLRDIDQLIRRLNLRLVRHPADGRHDDSRE
jgi:hypothetical protein